MILTPLPQGIVEWEYDGDKFKTYGTDIKSLSENTFISLTATPLNAGYVFSKWIGGPCNDSPNNVCTFELDRNRDFVAYFDLVTYTVSIIFIEGTSGSIYSVPAGIKTDPNSFGVTTTYDFVSGRVVTLYVNDIENSTYLGLYSDDVPSTTDTTLTFKVTGNITLTAQYLPFDQYTLSLNKYGTNKTIFESNPRPLLIADLSTTTASAEFIAGEFIDITKTSSVGSKVIYYRSSEPNINTYYAGTGISLGATSVDIEEGSKNALIFVNNSLIMNNAELGAPYAESTITNKPTGLRIDYGNINIASINEDTVLSAFMV